jgi:hypothetical protein
MQPVGPQVPPDVAPPAAPMQAAGGAVGMPPQAPPTPGVAPSPLPAPAPQPIKPPLPAAPLPFVQRTVPPREPKAASDTTNSFERVATMIVDSAQDLASRMAKSLSETPAGARELSADELKQMWFHSPAGDPMTADARFWEIHDQVLSQTGDHSQAETRAMEATYPYRLKLAQVGNASADRQVELAEALRKTVDGDKAPDTEQMGHDIAMHGMAIRNANGSV